MERNSSRAQIAFVTTGIPFVGTQPRTPFSLPRSIKKEALRLPLLIAFLISEFDSKSALNLCVFLF